MTGDEDSRDGDSLSAQCVLTKRGGPDSIQLVEIATDALRVIN